MASVVPEMRPASPKVWMEEKHSFQISDLHDKWNTHQKLGLLRREDEDLVLFQQAEGAELERR